MSEENEVGKTYQEIKNRCESLNVSISLVCREAGVDRSIIERWKSKDPKSIDTLNAINKAFEKLEKKEVQND